MLLTERPEAVPGKYPFLGAVVLVNQILDYKNTQIRQKDSYYMPFEICPKGALTSLEIACSSSVLCPLGKENFEPAKVS